MDTAFDTKISELCKAKQLRLTPQRLDVLKVINRLGEATGAYALLDILKPDHPKMTITSLYRILDFWVEQGLVHKINGLNAYIACNDPHDEHAHVLMFCDTCNKTVEICDHKAGFDAAATAGAQGFSKTAKQLVEFRGICQDCAG